MTNNKNFQITPALVKLVLLGIGALIILSVAMAFIRPWYNVWSQEMEGKAEDRKSVV